MLNARPVTPETPFSPCIDSETGAEWIRIDSGNTVEAEQVAELIKSAMSWIETYCHQPIFEREFYGYGPNFSDTCLHSLNVSDVSAVEYQVKGSAAWLSLDPAKYTFWETGEVQVDNSVRQIANVVRIRITYKAGYPDGSVPFDIIQVVRLLIGRWFDNRADEKKEVPSTAEWLIGGYVMPIM